MVDGRRRAVPVLAVFIREVALRGEPAAEPERTLVAWDG